MTTASGRKPAATRKPDARAAGRADSGAPEGRGSAAAAPAPSDKSLSAREQTQLFDLAVREFHARKFASAHALFEQAATGPAREVAHAALQHSRICAQRLARPELGLQTPDDHYNYAIALINQRRIEQAEKHLLHAVAQSPRGDHLYYALALCRGLAGDLEGAYLNLRHAIELSPRNRGAARNDPDFAEIALLAPLRDLLYPERTGTP